MFPGCRPKVPTISLTVFETPPIPDPGPGGPTGPRALHPANLTAHVIPERDLRRLLPHLASTVR